MWREYQTKVLQGVKGLDRIGYSKGISNTLCDSYHNVIAQMRSTIIWHVIVASVSLESGLSRSQ